VKLALPSVFIPVVVAVLGSTGIFPAHAADPSPAAASFRVIAATESRPYFSSYPPKSGVDDIYASMSADGAVLIGNARLWSYGLVSTSAQDAAVKAFRRIGDTREELGALKGASTGSSTARGLSGNGDVIVGEAGATFGAPDAVMEAFRWTAAGGMQRLFPTAQVYSAATGVSSDGMVITGSYLAPGSQFPRAFRWTAAGAIPLSPLPGELSSFGSCISADGSTIAGTSRSTGRDHACQWTVDGSVVALDPSISRSPSVPTAISADGSVIVGSAILDGGNCAFRWTAAEGIQRLGKARPSIAAAVSADGSVVVGSSPAGAFRWDAVHGMQSLADLLTAAGVDLGDVALEQALAISADGTTILGRGTMNVPHIPDYRPPTATWIAYLPVVPEIPAATPEPTPEATPSAEAPPLLGAIKATLRNSRVIVTGTASGAISRILFRVDGNRYRQADGTTSWRFVVPQRGGRKVATVIATGPGGRSEAATVTLPRK